MSNETDKNNNAYGKMSEYLRRTLRGKTMQTCATTQDSQRRAALKESDSRTRQYKPNVHVADRALSWLEMIMGLLLGIHIGLATGWVTGRYIGNIRAEQMRPTVDVLNLTELKEWYNIPWTYTRAGAAIGALLGIVVIDVVQTRFLKMNVLSLHKKGITDPVDMAGILVTRPWKTKRMVERLAKKGVIPSEAVDSSQRTPNLAQIKGKPSRAKPDTGASSGKVIADNAKALLPMELRYLPCELPQCLFGAGILPVTQSRPLFARFALLRKNPLQIGQYSLTEVSKAIGLDQGCPAFVMRATADVQGIHAPSSVLFE